MNERQKPGRRGHRNTPSYENPALCQILQSLSDLPFDRSLKDSSASQLSSFHGAPSTLANNAHEFQATEDDGVMSYHSSRSRFTKPPTTMQVTARGLNDRSSPPSLDTLQGSHQLPAKQSRVATNSQQVYPTPSPEALHFDPLPFNVTDRQVDSSPKPLWFVTPMPIETHGSPGHQICQSEGLQDFEHDAGFDLNRHRLSGPRNLSRAAVTLMSPLADYGSPDFVSENQGAPPPSLAFFPGPRGHVEQLQSRTHATTMPEVNSQLHPPYPSAIRATQMIHPRPFIPSTQALQQAGMGLRDPARMPPGSKYQGDAFSWSYLKQVPNLADHLNTSLWLKGLPPTVQPAQVFDLIHSGAVWSLDLKPTTEEHATVAATLTFKTSYAAAAFWKLCRFQGIQIDGYWISASYNKFGVPESASTESRVLQVEGPEHLMEPAGWEVQFKKACRFQIDRWSYLACPFPGRARMEFRFVRIDGQAQSCRQMIERELGYLGITVWYGMDPCGHIGY